MRLRWEPTGPEEDEWARMKGRSITDPYGIPHIMGVPMHIDAHAVHIEDGHWGEIQTADHEWGEEAITPLYNGMIDMGDGPHHTFTHTNGRMYVIIAWPFCQ